MYTMSLLLLFSLAITSTMAAFDPVTMSKNLRVRAPDPPNFSYETLKFKMKGGPASYDFSFPADGNSHKTGNKLSVSIVDPSSFPALYMCNFYTPDGSSIRGLAPGNGSEVVIGPPQPVGSVACAATGKGGSCLPVYASCEFNSNYYGTYTLNCCSGYCAATKCRCTTPGGCP